MTLHSGKWIAVAAAFCALAIAADPPPAAGQTQLSPYEDAQGLVQVFEGDLISVGGKLVRLYGIDAPEIGQQCESAAGRAYDCGEASRKALESMIGSRMLNCTLFAKLEGSRFSGLCRHGNQDIGYLQVERGWAFVARGLSNRYIRVQTQAQIRKAGLWAGRAQRPWVYRQDQVISGAARP